MAKTARRREDYVKYVLAGVVLLAFLFELIRDSQRDGDFIGYVNAGNAVLQGSPIYADFLNTWPPFFSIASVPLALVHNFSPVLIRALWLIGIAFAWFGILRISTSLLYNQPISFRDKKGIHPLDWKILLPFLFTFRFVIDDLSNIQINSYLLLGSLYAIKLDKDNKSLTAGLLLGLLVTLKVYPVFLLLFFLWRRRWKVVAGSCITIALSVGITWAVFGQVEALNNYQSWLNHKAMGETIMTHKNQSMWPWLQAMFSGEVRLDGIRTHLVDFPPKTAKRIAMGIIAVLGLIPAYRLRYRSNQPTSFHQFAFVLAAIPLLSPLAWKYYFVFLFPLYLVLSRLLFSLGQGRSWHKWIFFIALGLSILST
ncbi:MAG: DUF2029 domain-containing protein, partial [Bacteroidia bacterium]|nr:DUF2029 domain-containing protein [Bacteroidia bacterium]